MVWNLTNLSYLMHRDISVRCTLVSLFFVLYLQISSVRCTLFSRLWQKKHAEIRSHTEYL
jgi:hypothetical protein